MGLRQQASFPIAKGSSANLVSLLLDVSFYRFAGNTCAAPERAALAMVL